jgi:hypothetical protein
MEKLARTGQASAQLSMLGQLIAQMGHDGGCGGKYGGTVRPSSELASGSVEKVLGYAWLKRKSVESQMHRRLVKRDIVT